MSLEIVCGLLILRSWRLTDAEALSAAIEENLDHLRPFLASSSDDASAGVPARLGFRRVAEESREPKAPAETGVHVVWRVTRAEWTTANPT